MRRNAFTLVELLVVLAIVAILIALLLPAVQAAREAARGTECRNKLHQMSLAIHNHISSHGHLPGDGWGHWWGGDPDRGFGLPQTGAWLYRILPYTEASELFALGSDGQPATITAQQMTGVSNAIQVHLPWFNCPSRRGARLSQLRTDPWEYRNIAITDQAATISYFANWGSLRVWYNGGVMSLDRGPTIPGFQANGVIYTGSDVRVAQIEDGLTKTYLVGDMFWNIDPSGTSGFMENYRGIGTPFAGGYVAAADKQPKRDTLQETVEIGRWGSAHPSAWNMSLCDGSVRSLSYQIDSLVHQNLANRSDGQVIESLD